MATPVTPTAPAGRRTALHVSLWTVQVALAVVFGMAGFMKTTLVMPELGEQLFWTTDVPLPLVRFIGASELAAALGLILPALTRIKPILTAWAAVGLLVVMILATGFHAMRGEFAVIPMTLTFAAMAGFVAWGRFAGRLIAPR